jgi:hypothetical protein
MFWIERFDKELRIICYFGVGGASDYLRGAT